MAPIAPNLKITPAPFKPSRLGIPSSPFSPRSPITPPLRPFHESYAKTSRPTGTRRTNPPPGAPLLWLWRCHKCNHNYALGATRRCLEDGHHFCSGTTVIQTRRTNGKTKFKRHKSCTSEFDYGGWKRWSDWRRGQTGYVSVQDSQCTLDSATSGSPPRTPKPRKDCWNKCDYPSECRWGAESTPSPSGAPPVISPVALTDATASTPQLTSFDSILNLGGPIKQAQQSSEAAAPTSPAGESLGSSFWQTILNATRSRRSAGSNNADSSPLRLDSVREEGENDDEKSPTATPDPSPTEEVMQEFEDVMDIDAEAQDGSGELQMSSSQLRQFDEFDEDVDLDDESIDEEVAAIARYGDTDMELDPRLGDFDFILAK